jgi:hypothetical protein
MEEQPTRNTLAEIAASLVRDTAEDALSDPVCGGLLTTGKGPTETMMARLVR